MGTTALAVAKAAIAAITDPKARKAIGWTLVAILSPFILLVALLCSLGSGTAQHNTTTVNYCFFGGTLTDRAPAECSSNLTTMRNCFSLLDTSIGAANLLLPSGIELDSNRIKSTFFSLCIDDPGSIGISQFVGCFFTQETHTRTVTSTDANGNQTQTTRSYTVAKTVSQETAYSRLANFLGRDITAEDRSNIDEVYAQACGYNDAGSYDGYYQPGGPQSVALDISDFTNPTTKNAHDLVAYATHAWESGWGYVWGTYGNILTEPVLENKLQQYPDGVGKYEDFIRSHWLNGRTTDCVGLIKGYGWLDTNTLTIRYGTNGMPDLGANTMYQSATVKGPIRTMPDTPGLAVWMDGHIGVYVGNGEVIEASGTKKGVIKTKLEGRGWTRWLEIPYIDYS